MVDKYNTSFNTISYYVAVKSFSYLTVNHRCYDGFPWSYKINIFVLSNRVFFKFLSLFS